MTNKVVFDQHEIFVSLTLYPVYSFLSSRLLSLFLLTICPLFHLQAVEILQEMKSGEREHNTFFPQSGQLLQRSVWKCDRW